MISLLISLSILVVASITLVKSATLLVYSISKISSFFRLSEFTISFIVMGFITSLPEIAVAVNAALNNDSTLALGTALGSNLTDLTLIIAIPTLVAGGLRVRSIITRRDALVMCGYLFIPVILSFDGTISRSDGVILLIFYGLYLYRLIAQRTHFTGFTDHVSKSDALQQIGKLALGIVLLFVASQFIVTSSIQIAEIIKIPLVLVGLILVSAGTSLPELAHGLKAVKMHHDRQVLGDILGSVVANSTVVIAIAAIINPIHSNGYTAIIVTIGFLAIVAIMFLVGVYSDKKLDVKEALILLGIYLIYLLTEFGLEIINQTAIPSNL